MDYKKLARIIVRVKLQTASEEERAILHSWLDERIDNHQLYKMIMRGKSIHRRLKLEEEMTMLVNLLEVRDKIWGRLVAKRRIRRKKFLERVAVAACFCGMAFLFFWFDQNRERDLVLPAPAESEKPVEVSSLSGVMLVLASGERVMLSSAGRDSIILSQALFAGHEDVWADQVQGDSLKGYVEWNRIITPKGGDYSFTLSDGSRVWMNAESVLEFPVHFVGNERVVRLTGEAYFEVKSDSSKPFIVETGEMQTRVLGTSFNVKAYDNESSVYTTLIKGKVVVSLKTTGTEKIILKPGMQSEWKRESRQIMYRRVNTDLVVAWREGVFKFEETDLEVVLRVLSRWYGVQFVYDAQSLKKHTFNGYVSKDESLASILETFTMAGGPKFRIIDENTVEIIERR